MAGIGPPPKDQSQRRNRATKQRGEWRTLPLENPARVPAMPKSPKGGWAAGTRSAWKQWWKDPASILWTPADVEAVRALAMLHHELERGKFSLAPEVRLRQDGLGLTQKGKRDLRLRILDDDVEDGGTGAVVDLNDRRARMQVV
jgi:hypothetical protein